MKHSRSVIVALISTVAVSCTAVPTPAPANPDDSATAVPLTTTTAVAAVNSRGLPFPPAPDAPNGPFDDDTAGLIDQIWSGLPDFVDAESIRRLGETDDIRVAWIIADLLRFAGSGEILRAAIEALAPLTGVQFNGVATWVSLTDHLIAWDTPGPPGYLEYKRRLFTVVDERWEFVFAEPNVMDMRHLSWGGVLIDDRPLGDPNPCPRGCIPALDDPAVTDVAGGAWYPDDAIVFGVVIGGEARAYPKNIMEIHEMVNDTLGGRRFAMPYCTLCASAQVFFTDDLAGFAPVLRTSGLLSRSNKVMYDLETRSVFDTFTGAAVTGPLLEAGVVLEQAGVVTSPWGEWKAAHPDTTIVAADGGIGRTYDLDPLRGRDDNGPIFPIGDRDLRLGVQEQVLGVVAPDGTAIAFPVRAAQNALANGEVVSLAGVEVVMDGGGVRALAEGVPIGSHQAFWFAWSQFHPDTLLWEG
ncbi:MAG TPA: DUF3179 domain-containing (seleno)protein [Acidimicrobiia bacterium]|nr:DUF3179 domain-containing (seleno)protein [Acidimicrobiia bacterium]